MFARGGIAFMLGCAWHRAAPDTSLVRIVAVLYPAHLNSRAAMASAVEAARPRPNSVTTPGAGRQSD